MAQFISLHSHTKCSPCPILTTFKARFAFSRGEVVQDVPYDPHLEYVWLGMVAGHIACNQKAPSSNIGNINLS